MMDRYRYIPSHLIPEILSKLPVKSLLKFRCVSKSWLSVISSHQFIKVHLEYHTSRDNQSLLVLENHYGFKYCSLTSLLCRQASPHDLLPQDERNNDRNLYRCFEIVGSCDGLICICVHGPSQSDFLLWNPSTRKHKKLPDLILPSTVSLSGIWGFGYDASSDDYKVVVLVISREYWRYQTIVYSTKTAAWRRIADLPNDPSYLSSGVMVEGKLHFVAKEKLHGGYILSLDLATEMYRELEAPSPKENDLLAKLGEIRGNLWFYKIPDLNGCLQAGELWIMKEYGKSWTKVISVSHENSGLLFFPKILDISAKGELLLLESGRIGVYNSREEQCFRPFELFNNVRDASCFIESLTFPGYK